MPVDPVLSPADEVFASFVRELARSPQRSHILTRLEGGHHPDPHGWCSHPAHDHRWERHPCATLRLAEWVEATDPRDRPPEPDQQDTANTPDSGLPVARYADPRTRPHDQQVR